MKKKQLLPILLSLLLVFGCAAPEAPSDSLQAAPTSESTAADAHIDEPTPKLDHDLVVLYTNDVHCAVEEGVGYAGLSAFKNGIEQEGDYVALVDAGDAVQGGAIGTVSKGSYLVDIMNKLDYDVAVPGNHEFDYGMDAFFALRDAAEFPYVSANFTDLKTGKTVLDPYEMLEFNGVNVAFVGVCTPKTITSSTPVYFQDDSGAFIYSFAQDATGKQFYDAVQTAVDAARAEGAKYVIAVAHLGIDASCTPWTSPEFIANTSGIDAVIDGHSHSVVECERVKNKAGERVLLTQTGTRFANIGMLVITKSGSISTGLIGDYAQKDPATEAYIAEIESEYSEAMQQIVATSTVDLTINQPETDPPVRIVRRAETNLGDLCADAYRTIGEADVGFINGGGVRVSIPAGNITYEQILNVHPFGNNLCVIEATGQQILDALEMGARAVPAESGGFLQVSGLTYEIHTYVPSSVVLSDEGMFESVAGDYRVKNVQIGGAPLDLAKTYTVASHDYMLKNSGDGFTMFAGCKVLRDMVMVDNQMLMQYISETLNGTIGEAYANPFGQERIVAVEKKPVE